MKTNAMVRIILYTLTIVLLVFLLCVGLGLREFAVDLDHGSGTTVEYEASVEAESAERIEINWAAGSIHIKREDVSRIIFREVAQEEIRHKMTFRYTNNTLTLNYSGQKFGFAASQEKHLVVIVPLDWKGECIQINGADLAIDIIDLEIDELDLDGASCYLNFSGCVDKVSIDGASAQVKLNCTNHISQIEMDGASCKLDVTLPVGCGFRVDMDGLGCKFNSDLPGIAQNGSYTYGDQHCKIEVDGLGCKVSIQDHTSNMMSYSVRCGDDFTASLLLEALDEEYAPGTIVTLKTDILTDVDLELYINGEFVCSQTEVVSPDGSNYWEFQFTMRNEPVVIHFKTVDGILR